MKKLKLFRLLIAGLLVVAMLAFPTTTSAGLATVDVILSDHTAGTTDVTHIVKFKEAEALVDEAKIEVDLADEIANVAEANIIQCEPERSGGNLRRGFCR